MVSGGANTSAGNALKTTTPFGHNGWYAQTLDESWVMVYVVCMVVP
jgi:hypothetical protein